jgi:uncharacterized protein
MLPDVQARSVASLAPGYRNLVAHGAEGDFTQNMLHFCERLRRRGMMVGVSDAAEALGILPKVDLEDWCEFYLVLRSLFVSRWEDLPVFDAQFHSFWTGWGGLDQNANQLFETPPERTCATRAAQQGQERAAGATSANEDAGDRDKTSLGLYSAEESLARRLFHRIERDEMREMERTVRRLGKELASRPGRRTACARKGHSIDLRRSIRRSLGHGGEVLTLVRKVRKLRRIRLVLLLDVSRSMDIYSQFLLKLIYSLHSLRGTTESFVFGTGLQRVTACFRATDVNSALARLSDQVPFWSGGTRIGQSFRLFNMRYANRVLDNGTILMVLSDGLDTEHAELVAEELAIMKQRVRKLIWLNPLADTQGYEPLAGSMAAALPYINEFTSIERFLSGRNDFKALGV